MYSSAPPSYHSPTLDCLPDYIFRFVLQLDTERVYCTLCRGLAVAYALFVILKCRIVLPLDLAQPCRIGVKLLNSYTIHITYLIVVR